MGVSVLQLDTSAANKLSRATEQESHFLTDHLRLPIDTCPPAGHTVLLGNWPSRLAAAAVAVPKIRALIEPLGRISVITGRSLIEEGLFWWLVTFESADSVRRAERTSIEVSKAVEGGLKGALQELQEELGSMEEPRLIKEANLAGVEKARLDDALEAQTPSERKAHITDLIVNCKRAALQEWAGSGTGAVTLELKLAEVDHSVSSTRTVLLRRAPDTTPPDKECMIRVGNLPPDPKPIEINRKLADVFADTLFEDAHRHPNEKQLDSAESAVTAVTVQLRKGFRANLGMVTLTNEACTRRFLRQANHITPTYWDPDSAQEVMLDTRMAEGTDELQPVPMFSLLSA